MGSQALGRGKGCSFGVVPWTLVRPNNCYQCDLYASKKREKREKGEGERGKGDQKERKVKRRKVVPLIWSRLPFHSVRHAPGLRDGLAADAL